MKFVMKKDFTKLVDQIVKGWHHNKNKLLEEQGLGGLSNRKYGDRAEDYVLKKVKQLNPDYKPVKSNNSESPADIFAVTYRN